MSISYQRLPNLTNRSKIELFSVLQGKSPRNSQQYSEPPSSNFGLKAKD